MKCGLDGTMAEAAQVLTQGNVEWNKWRTTENGHRFRCLSFRLPDTLNRFNFDNLNFKEMSMGDTCLNKCDFRGAKIENVNMSNSQFTECDFSEVEFADVDLNGSKFDRCKFLKANFKNVAVDEKTLIHCCDMRDAKVSLSFIEQLEFNKVLSPNIRRQIRIVDPMVDLKRMFSGFYSWSNAFGMVCFVFPYAWFTLTQLIRSDFSAALLDGGETSPLVCNLAKYTWSGGQTWRTWQFHWMSIIAAIYFLYNCTRGYLWWRMIDLEHQRGIFGVYPKLGQFDERLIQSFGWFSALALLFALVHSWIILLRDVPL
ncbi:MAG: pentapeptide repeat-containing protein [Planctomycetaceae bacterium]|nr:pentapeptide repeat-containing protein [Planctomycetaceae bacterium]